MRTSISQKSLAFLWRSAGFLGVLLVAQVPVSSQEFRNRSQPLIDASCIDCHDGSEPNGLDFSKLKGDLSDDATFRKWERIFDRVRNGEMPPESESRPTHSLVAAGLDAIESALTKQNVTAQQRDGRVILRRLTRSEYQFTLNDLLQINAELAGSIPEENSSNGFDTVSSAQGLSSQHVRGYLAAAEKALDAAIQLGEKPETQKVRIEYTNSRLIREHIEKANDKDRVIVKALDDAVVMFHTASYLFNLDHHFKEPGRYIVRAEASTYQSETPLILTLNANTYGRGSSRILGSFDVSPDQPRQVEVECYLEGGNSIFPGVEEAIVQPDGKTIWNIGPDEFKGSGIAIKWLELEGPLVDAWPPVSTTSLLRGVELKELPANRWDHARQKHLRYEIIAGDDPEASLKQIIAALAPRLFRRPPRAGEGDPMVKLGRDAINTGQSFEEAVRIACRAAMTSPQFLFMTADPGKLDDFSLASRLSYFLWKTLPDDELFELARSGQLHNPAVLSQQVERMLADPRSDRFIHDFVDQWLQLNQIDATSPDMLLYPDYDDLLKYAMLEETYHFVRHLIDQDLSASNLIDSDFTFLNRRLAKHYEIGGVEDQHIRKVDLDANSIRGGLMTQASIMKVTANGTSTSPVRRGNWVLTHLLGTPPSPPPPGVGSIEPDTRGTTTVREMLDKHRNDVTCARCHRLIDPPGFALECMDVVGGYREKFRAREGTPPDGKTFKGRRIWEYKIGLPVDASGALPSGESFEGIKDYKRLLMNQKEQVARNLISQLIVYSTGAEIQFADRAEVEQILERCRVSDLGLRTMIHEVVQSKLFLNK